MEPPEIAASVPANDQPASAGGDVASPSSSADSSGPRRSSESVASDAQAFLDAAYAELDGGSGTPPATPATPAEATAAEEIAAEDPAAEERRLSRKERAEQARGGPKPAEATPAAAPDPAPAPPPAPAGPSPDEIIAAYERQRADRERADQEARRQADYYAGWLGNTREAPNGPTEYERLQAVVFTPVPAVSEFATNDEIAAHNEAVNRQSAAVTRLRELNERRAMLAAQEQPVAQRARQEAITFVAGGFEQAIADTGADLEIVLRAGAAVPDLAGRVPAMVRALAEQVAARAVAPKDAEITRLTADLSERDEEIAAHKAEIDGLRKRLGGRMAQPERGGVAASSGRPSIEALDAIHPTKLRTEDLDAYMDLLPAGPSRRR